MFSEIHHFFPDLLEKATDVNLKAADIYNRKVFKSIIFKKIMKIVNEITVEIVKNAKDGESIYSLSSKTGFAYSAVYKWVCELKKILEKRGIAYSEDIINNKRPFVIIIKKQAFEIERKNGLPVMPLRELVEWGKELRLDNILEQLDELYNLKLNIKYAEVSTNA